MYVCEGCHDKDEKVTKCTIPFQHHPVHVMSPCDVCGKVDILAGCWAYNYLKITEKFKCSSAKDAMNEIDG